MVPMEMFALEHEGSEDGEDSQRDHLLNHLQLHQGVWSPVAHEAEFVSRHLQRVLEEGDTPREDNHQPERPAVRDVHLLEFEVSVPSQGHKDVAADEQQDGVKSVYHCSLSICAAKVTHFI